MSTRAQLTTAAAARDYTLAGNATMTLASAASGREFTFRVRPWDRGGHVVKLIVDGSRPEYVGLIDGRGFRLTGASGFTSESLAVKAFSFYWRSVTSGREDIPSGLTVHHEGKCGACGRALKISDSVDLGMGSTCLKRRMALMYA